MKVPAYVVFTDNTLIAIAKRYPPTTPRWSPFRVSARASSSSSDPMFSTWSATAS